MTWFAKLSYFCSWTNFCQIVFPSLKIFDSQVSLPRTRDSTLIQPPSIINGIAVSKTFQILYRNEEVVHDNLVFNDKLIIIDDQVLLDDVIQYRVHILLDSARWSLIMIITD